MNMCKESKIAKEIVRLVMEMHLDEYGDLTKRYTDNMLLLHDNCKKMEKLLDNKKDEDV